MFKTFSELQKYLKDNGYSEYLIDRLLEIVKSEVVSFSPKRMILKWWNEERNLRELNDISLKMYKISYYLVCAIKKEIKKRSKKRIIVLWHKCRKDKTIDCFDIFAKGLNKSDKRKISRRLYHNIKCSIANKFKKLLPDEYEFIGSGDLYAFKTADVWFKELEIDYQIDSFKWEKVSKSKKIKESLKYI